MSAQNVLIALGSAIAGGLVVALLMHPAGPTASTKSDRLSGPPAETAFLPERFGVPGSAH
ncbi:MULTISPECIES: hypothetical protein [Neorhizobium]|uniref:hypothetical protein n=1 Tax=Neorhizobium TaxID=1525371 RepID=UPI000CF8CA0E|nr:MULTISPECIES: hypothetical protein [unclassified Neorhizobium]